MNGVRLRWVANHGIFRSRFFQEVEYDRPSLNPLLSCSAIDLMALNILLPSTLA